MDRYVGISNYILVHLQQSCMMEEIIGIMTSDDTLNLVVIHFSCCIIELKIGWCFRDVCSCICLFILKWMVSGVLLSESWNEKNIFAVQGCVEYYIDYKIIGSLLDY